MYFFYAAAPKQAMAFSFMRFLDQTQRRTTVGRTLSIVDQPVAETSTWQHTTLKQTSMPPAGIETTISASERPHIYAFDRSATGTGFLQE